MDSLWLTEMVYGPLVEPFVGMTWALARTTRLKVGTGVTVLPGRHPVLVAKQLARWPPSRRGGCCPSSACARPPGERALFPVPHGRAPPCSTSRSLLRRC